MNRAGMTLIEVTLALLLVSGALVTGYELYDALQRTSTALDTSLSGLMEESAARSLLSSWVRRPVLRSGQAGFLGFDGRWDGAQDDRLELWVRGGTPAHQALTRVNLFVDRDDATPQEGLVASLTTPGAGRPVLIELAGSVGSLDIKYVPSSEGGSRALSSWQSQSVTPRAVIVELGPAPGRELPSLLARPWTIAVGDAR
jgi:hypothetical protein